MDADAAPESGSFPSLARTNRILAVVAILATGWAIYGTILNQRQLVHVENYLGAVKVPVPGVTLFAMEYQSAGIGLLIALATVSAIASSRKEGRMGTLYLNVATIVIALSWWAFHSTAFYLFTVSLMEMFPRKR